MWAVSQGLYLSWNRFIPRRTSTTTTTTIKMRSPAQNEMGKSSGAKSEEPICRHIKEQEVVCVLHGDFPDLDVNIMTWTLWWTLMLAPAPGLGPVLARQRLLQRAWSTFGEEWPGKPSYLLSKIERVWCPSRREDKVYCWITGSLDNFPGEVQYQILLVQLEFQSERFHIITSLQLEKSIRYSMQNHHEIKDPY